MKTQRKAVSATDAESLRQAGVSRTTAWRAAKRGWYCPDYRKRWQPGTNPSFDAKAAYDLAHAVFYRHFWPSFTWLKDDMCQDAVIRLWEISGGDVNPGIQYGTARNAMRDCITKWKTRGESLDENILVFEVDEEYET